MDQVHELLKAKQKEHGYFQRNARTYRKLIVAAFSDNDDRELSYEQYGAVTQIMWKLARIVSTTSGPENADNWRDIAGYALLGGGWDDDWDDDWDDE